MTKKWEGPEKGRKKPSIAWPVLDFFVIIIQKQIQGS